MGQEQSKQKPPQKSIEDHIIQMKINAKQVQRSAKKSQKQSEKYMKQAKQALKKNNQDFAKMYLTSASQKRNEANNYQRTAIKMQLMCDQIKSMKNNQKLAMTFGNLSQAVSMQMGQTDTVKMAQNLQVFNDKMDEAMINNKMMTQIMSNNDIVDTNADAMLNVLKQQITLQDQTNLAQVGGQKYKVPNQINQQQYKANNTGQKKQQEIDDDFLNQLKGL